MTLQYVEFIVLTSVALVAASCADPRTPIPTVDDHLVVGTIIDSLFTDCAYSIPDSLGLYWYRELVDYDSSATYSAPSYYFDWVERNKKPVPIDFVRLGDMTETEVRPYPIGEDPMRLNRHPVTFFSLPGLNAARDTAFVAVAAFCRGCQWCGYDSGVVLTRTNNRDWSVASVIPEYELH